MLGELPQDLRRHGGDFSAELGSLDDVEGVAHRGDENLGFEGFRIIVENLANLRDQRHAIVSDVVEAADEGGHESGPGLGRQERLGRRKAEGHVDHDSGLGERAAGFQPVPGQGNLDRDVVGPRGQDATLADHVVEGGGGDLGTDGSRDDFADLVEDFKKIAPAAGDERGIGGHAVEQTSGREILDLVDVGGVDKELHDSSFAPFNAALFPHSPSARSGCRIRAVTLHSRLKRTGDLARV